MADWTYRPTHPYRPRPRAEKVLINELEDNSELRAEKGPTFGGTYVEEYESSGAELKAMLAFFASKRLVTPFTKKTYDPLDSTWDPDDPAQLVAGPEETVRFAREPVYTMVAVDHYRTQFEFKRLPNE